MSKVRLDYYTINMNWIFSREIKKKLIIVLCFEFGLQLNRDRIAIDGSIELAAI